MDSSSTCDADTSASGEFIPGYDDVNGFTQEALKSLMMSVKKSNDLPSSGEDYSYYSSFSAYQEIMDVESKRILQMMHDIMRHCGIKGNLTDSSRALEIDDKFDILVDANDQILERAGSLLDDAEGLKKKETTLVIASATPKNSYTASWNKQKIPGSDSKGTKFRLLTARNIQRPQMKFSDKIDNTSQPFVPKIKHKPNALKPLQDCFIIAKQSEEVSSDIDQFQFPHPYKYELDHFTPLDSQVEKVTPQEAEDFDSTTFTFVDTEAGVSKLLAVLKMQTEIAVDLEHHSYRSFQGFTCLMQISTRKQDFLIDTIALRNQLQSLNEVFTDPKVVKVLHGSDSDIGWLQRDLGLYIVNMFDTHQAAKLFNLPRLSLAYLLKMYCDVTADKQYQLADWRMRPLPKELLRYAREDTHYLLYIYDRMKNELIERGNQQANLLLSVLQRSTQLCLKVYQKPRFNEERYLEFYKKSKKRFNSRQLNALKEIFSWRDEIARTEDESYGYVLPNHMLLQIAEVLPRELQGILACCNPIPPLIHQCVTEIHRIILHARELPLEKVTKTKQPLIGPPKYEHAKYEPSSLLYCPHDSSHDHPTHATQHQLDMSLLTQTPVLSLMNVAEDMETSKSSEAQKKAAKIRSTFTSPFKKYLPVSMMTLMQNKYGAESSMEDSSTIQSHEKWRLLNNTETVSVVVEEEVPKPVSQPVPDTDFIGTTEAEDDQPIRQKKSKKAQREKQRDSSTDDHKTKKTKYNSEESTSYEAVKTGDFQQFDYGQAASKLFQESKKERKRKEYDGNAVRESHEGKGPSKSKQHQKFGTKSMTFSRSSGSHYGGTQQRNWPKR